MNTNLVRIFVVAVVAVLALGAVGVAYAQTPTQEAGTDSGSGWMGGSGSRGNMGAGQMAAGDGILHDYLIAAYAEKLNIPAADLEARLSQGETMSQIAASTGLTIDQFRTLMVEARTQAIDQAVTGGTLTPEQADWMKLRGAGQMAGGQMGNGRGMRSGGQGQHINPDCPNYSQTNP
jgi:Spy/CpxP family protein refolding chaperone